MDNITFIGLLVLLSGLATWFVVVVTCSHVFIAHRQARAYNRETKALLRIIEQGQIATGAFEDGRETYEENDRRRAGYNQSIS